MAWGSYAARREDSSEHEPGLALVYAAKVEAIQQLYTYMAVRAALIS